METSGGSDTLIHHFISKTPADFQERLIKFILSENKKVRVERLDLKFYRLENKGDSFWTYLYMTGYFNAEEISENIYELSFPNKEVSELFISEFVNWKWDTYKEKLNEVRINGS